MSETRICLDRSIKCHLLLGVFRISVRLRSAEVCASFFTLSYVRSIDTTPDCCRMGNLTCDRFLTVYDLRLLRPMTPMQVMIDPLFLRFVPTYSNRICVVSQVCAKVTLCTLTFTNNPQNFGKFVGHLPSWLNLPKIYCYIYILYSNEKHQYVVTHETCVTFWHNRVL